MIVINYGTALTKNTTDTLIASDISAYLKPGMNVAIKPNLVLSEPASNGATTHPEVVEGIIIFLKEFGIKNIEIIESSWVGDSTKRAFKACGYEQLSKKYNIPLFDLKSDKCTTLTYDDLSMSLCNKALHTDFLINVPVLKAHCQTRLTCNMKNLKGCIPDSEKRRFHTIGLHKPIAALNALMKTGYCVVDGICGDLSFEEGGNPVESNRIIAGRNPLVVDSYCAELIGYRPNEIGYLTYGKEMGLGEFYTDKIEIIELNPENKPIHSISRTGKAAKHRRFTIDRKFINEDSACSACYSALIYALHRLRGQPSEKIHIGQGFKSVSGDGIGIGNCACGFSRNVPGCPPKATDILERLQILQTLK
ncbi:MAG: DUF362 domain-containing protein [Oscillospiraceae bacterium]|nr:DUF362 domain-containing protein [Oscillospiraceae bacterium]